MIRRFIFISIFTLILNGSFAIAGTTGSEELSKSNSQNTADECFEGVSRAMFKFNHALDKVIFKPVAKGFRALPVPIRKGTGNAVDNLRSLLSLSITPQFLLMDAFEVTGIDIPQKAIVRGDSLSMSIAAASILAKETRASMMIELHETFPEYGFDSHKGYGTKKHIEALKLYGPCSIHRRTFRPVSELIGGLDVVRSS